MAGERRRPGRARSSWWTITALAVGAGLLMTGGYLQLRDTDNGSTSTTQPTGTTTAASGTPSPTPRSSTPPPELRRAGPAQPGDPVKVSVPSLGVSARILAIRARGDSLIPPSNPRLVGWWSDGAKPGAARGSAIITGHTVHTGGGAFDNLNRLVAGDSVTVTAGRETIRYAVASVTTYRKKTLAKRAAQVFSQTVPGRLVLVTCEDWDGTTYLSNTVVIADRTT